ncbi:hypothetical protein MKX01_026741 [Papaver californicum]|nr:hypothetical protein MKX01_026741 [Papaver californicum]
MATSAMNIVTPEIQGTTQDDGNSNTHIEKPVRTKNWLMIIINCVFAICGTLGGPLLMRLYFLHGGKRIWFSSFIGAAGFPILIFPLMFLFIRSKSFVSSSFWLEPKLLLWGAILGILYDLVSFMYALDQLGYQNLTVLGFLLTLVAAALLGLMMPLIELAYTKATSNITYSILLQFQFILSLFAAIVCLVGMLVNKDFQAIPREANDFELGKANYYIIVVGMAILWQLQGVGTVGVIFYTSALFNGILGAVLVPLTGVAALIFYQESFTGLKGMALALCLWGFCSYFYGEYKMMHQD